MEREVSIVLVREAKNYRKLAQQWYNLTDEQMEGCDVHHNPPRHQGGRNIPEHLFVYHHTLHSEVHGDDFTKWARKGGRAGGKVSGAANLAKIPRETLVASGKASGKANGAANLAKIPREILVANAAAMNDHENTQKSRSANGKASIAKMPKETLVANQAKIPRETLVANGQATGASNLATIPKETLVANGKANMANMPKETLADNAKNTNSQRWQCLVTGHVSNPGNLSKYQKARGINTSMRKRV
jgi:hypothetical protein